VLRLIRSLAQGERVVVVATHDSRMLPLADRVVELIPALASTSQLPETVHLTVGEVLFEQSTMGNLIYVVSAGEFEIVREWADGGEELVKVAGPGELRSVKSVCCSTCRARRPCGPEPTPQPSATRRMPSVRRLGVKGLGRPDRAPRACQRLTSRNRRFRDLVPRLVFLCALDRAGRHRQGSRRPGDHTCWLAERPGRVGAAFTGAFISSRMRLSRLSPAVRAGVAVLALGFAATVFPMSPKQIPGSRRANGCSSNDFHRRLPDSSEDDLDDLHR